MKLNTLIVIRRELDESINMLKAQEKAAAEEVKRLRSRLESDAVIDKQDTGEELADTLELFKKLNDKRRECENALVELEYTEWGELPTIH